MLILSIANTADIYDTTQECNLNNNKILFNTQKNVLTNKQNKNKKQDVENKLFVLKLRVGKCCVYT